MSEKRIRAAYSRRSDPPMAAMGSGDRYIHRRRDEALARLLSDAGVSLGSVAILEIGCGDGRVLATLSAMGAGPEKMAGIDLLDERVEEARALLPEADIREGNAENLPWPDESFDVLVQFTFLSSVIEADARRRCVTEMLRVVKPGGAILWYDFIWNPLNRDTRGINLREMEQLFAPARIQARRVTLVPQLARLLAPVSERFVTWLEGVPVLRTHYLALVLPTPAVSATSK